MTSTPRPLLRFGIAALALAAGACSCSEDPRPQQEEPVAVDVGYPEPDGGPVCTVDCNDPADGGVDAGTHTVKIQRVIPNRGNVAGGMIVTLEGGDYYLGFASGSTEAKKQTRVFFGSNEATGLQIFDNDTLEIIAPPNAAGATDVRIVNGNGTATCTGCFTYFVDLALTASAPASGPLAGGTELTLTGQGFTPELAVLIGGRSSPQVTFVDAQTVRAVVPAGSAAGPVDIRVFNKNGIGELRRAFTYVAPLTLTSVEPPYGALAGGVAVVLRGQNLAGTTELRFGAQPAAFTVRDSTTLDATVPAGASAGPVDVTASSATESHTLSRGFVYYDAASSGFAVAGILPNHGPAEGGNLVTLVGTGLAGTAQVQVGARAATVVSASANALVVRPSWGAPHNAVDVALSGPDGAATLAGAYRYDVFLSSVSPVIGPAAGGTVLTLSGDGFEDGLEVLVGGQQASSVAVLGRGSVTAITPPGGGGPADVTVRYPAAPDDQDTLAGAFRYQEPLRLGRVSPDTGAIAGGTYVVVLGTGFAPGVIATIGGSPLKDLRVVDANTLTGRTPPGNPGAADVAVALDGAQDVSVGGFTYFDPRNGTGGSSGGPLNGTLNVTVLDATYGHYGEPIPGATVMLGTDADTPFQGKTDRRGQITFSDPSLVKAQLVTVMKAGYLTVSVARQESQNLTVYTGMAAGGSGEPGFPPPLPPSIISGKVVGFKLPRPLRDGETALAEVWVAPTSVYSTPPFSSGTSPDVRDARGERWRITQDGGSFSVFSGRGLKALFAVYGILERASGKFTPVLMGVRKGVVADPSRPAINQDIVLDMHLDRSVPVTLENAPPPALPMMPPYNEAYAWLELGGDGIIPLSMASAEGAQMTLPNLPNLDGDSFLFLARGTNSGSRPDTYCYRRQMGDVSQGVTIGPLLGLPKIDLSKLPTDGTISWSFGPGPDPDMTELTVYHFTATGGGHLWSAYAPGADRSAALPGAVLAELRANAESGDLVLALMSAGRAPRFDWAYWSYSQLGLGAWTAWTEVDGSLTWP